MSQRFDMKHPTLVRNKLMDMTQIQEVWIIVQLVIKDRPIAIFGGQSL